MKKNNKKLKKIKNNIWSYAITIVLMITLCLLFNILDDKAEQSNIINNINDKRYNGTNRNWI